MYDSQATLRSARQQYFDRAGFDEGGYTERWVKLRAGGLVIVVFPNTAARVRAIKFHDLHHVLADYDTTWTGEAEIGAWEIASGCAQHYPAWLLNLGAFAIGLVIAPRRTFHAFVRGRHSRNLYREPFTDDLLAQTVGAVRTRLGLDEPREAVPSPADRLAFFAWSAIATVTTAAPGIAAIAMIVHARAG
jgi:hypothetical protein